MSFNINSQTGGVINNVAGDQRVSGGQEGTIVTIDAARDAVRNLQRAIASTPLARSTAVAARVHVEDLDAEIRKDTPDPSAVADRVRRLTGLLASTGALASAGASIVGPLQTLATWLGHLGEPISRMLSL
jgi:hypothetical protein